MIPLPMKQVGEDEGGDGFDDDGAAAGEAHVVPAADRQSLRGAALKVVGFLRSAYGRRRFEGDAEDNGGAVSQAAVDAAGAVLRRATVRAEGIVMLGALHRGSAETVAKFDTTNTRDCEHGMRNHGFDAVPEGLTHADGKILDDAFNDAAEGIPFFRGLGNQFLPVRRIFATAQSYKL